jgi:hypothetical protein
MVEKVNVEIMDIPSLREKFKYLFQADSPTAKVAQYVFTPSATNSGNIQFLTRMKLLRVVMATDGKPFYAGDVFGEFCECGGWINGMDLAHIVRSTGNTKEQFLPIGYDTYKKIEVKEWELAMPMADLLAAYDEVKMFIMDRM